MKITSAIVKYTGALTGRNQGIASSLSGRCKAYDDAPEIRGLMQAYYGFNPETFVDLTPEEFGQFVDQAKQAKFFSENWEKIAEHTKDYIQGIVDYNEFVTRCVKAGVAGMKKIDKNTLDVLLHHKSYKNNQNKLAQDSRVADQLIQQELTDYIDLSEYDLNMSLQMMAAKLLKEKEKINAKPEEEQARADAQQAEQERKQYIRNLLNYGYNTTIQRGLSAATSFQSNSSTTKTNDDKTLFSRAIDFFRGK
ncbi:MAG TPA: hypothetical protein V6D33_05390 [Cyanophyceae cyanobacterium]